MQEETTPEETIAILAQLAAETDRDAPPIDDLPFTLTAETAERTPHQTPLFGGLPY